MPSRRQSQLDYAVPNLIEAQVCVKSPDPFGQLSAAVSISPNESSGCSSDPLFPDSLLAKGGNNSTMVHQPLSLNARPRLCEISDDRTDSDFSVGEKMARFLQLQNKKYAEAVFQKHVDKKTGKLPFSELRRAMERAGVEELENDHALAGVDIDEDEGLDFDHFFKVISSPCKLEQWCATLPLAKLLAFCLRTLDPVVKAIDPIRAVSLLNVTELGDASADFCEGLTQLLADRVRELKTCYKALEGKTGQGSDGSNVKFQTFAMSAGKVEDFHKGLTDRVGELKLEIASGNNTYRKP